MKHVRDHAARITWAAAVLAWAAVITADTLNLTQHVWESLLTLAGILTGAAVLPALLSVQVADRVDRHYRAISETAIRRPDPSVTPSPRRHLRAADGDGQRPARHASL